MTLVGPLLYPQVFTCSEYTRQPAKGPVPKDTFLDVAWIEGSYQSALRFSILFLQW